MKGAILSGRIAAAILLTFATCYALKRWTIMPLRCARATWHGEQDLERAEQQSDASQRRVAAGIRMRLRDCESVANEELFSTLAEASDALGDPKSAMVEYQRALQFDRRPEIYFARGMSALTALDHKAAIKDLAIACAFAPARLADIPYEGIRREVRQRVLASYGDDWLR